MRYVYPYILDAEIEGGFFVRFPDLPEALTGGRDREDALAMAKDCLISALSLYVRNGEDVPAPSLIQHSQVPITVPPVIAAKLDLYAAIRKQCLSKSDLGARLGLSPSAISRLTDLRKPSNFERIETALRAVGRGLVVESHALNAAVSGFDR